MFEGLLINALILLASLLILDKASHLAIINSVKVADMTGFGKTTIGFILLAFSTSLPELSVAIFSAIGGGAIGVAVGNALGSNIVNVCLILGVCIVLVSLKKSKATGLVPFMTKEEIGSLHFGLFVASLVPLSLMYIGYASRFIGVILLTIFILYTYQLSKVKIIKEERPLGEERQKLAR